MAFNGIRDVAQSWGAFIRHSHQIVFAIRTEGKWVLHYGLTIFSPFLIESPKITIKTKSIFIHKSSELIGENLALQIINGSLDDPTSVGVLGEIFELRGESHLKNVQYYPMYIPRLSGPQRIPGVVCNRSGSFNINYPSTEILEIELKECDTPYDSFQEILMEINAGFIAREIGNWSSPITEIMIAPPIFLEKADLKAGSLNFTIKIADGIDKEKISTSLKLISTTPSPIKRVEFSGSIIWRADEINLGHFEESVEGIGTAQIFIKYDGDFVGSWWLRDSQVAYNARSAIHKIIDSDDLFTKKFFDDRNSFEERATILLTLLNLDCLFYGQIAELKDAPDILALSTQGHLYVVECSTGDISSRGKLRRLYERANEIRVKLANSSFRPREILPVIMTSVPHRETLHCISELQNYGIAVIAREGIERLLSQIETPPMPDQLFASALATIPRVGPQTASQVN